MYYSSGSGIMALVPPQTFRKTDGIIRLGTSANRPAATDVLPGTLYYSTDLTKIERSNGTTWDQYSTVTGGVTSVITDGSTGTVNNFAPTGMTGNTYCVLNGVSDLTITGLAGGVTGQIVYFYNNQARRVFFASNSGSSLAANRFNNYVISGATPLGTNGNISYIYNGSSWNILGHEQGGFITAVYNGANFTGPVTWTVDAGDIATMHYFLKDRYLTVTWFLGATTYAGGSNILYINNGAWGGFSANAPEIGAYILSEGPGNFTGGWWQIAAGDTKIQLLKYALANFAASTNNLNVYGQAVIEVQ